jgi:predicted N-acetyltransferase YhbS
MSIATSAMQVHIRRAAPADAEICGRICYEAFTAVANEHNFEPELPAPEAGIGVLQMLFTHPGFYGIVAEYNGRIAGSNCLDERSNVAGIGPVTVSPEVQDRSIGRLLMQAVMDRARDRGFAGVRLVQSAYHNRSLALYAKLGFDAREPLSVMNGTLPRVVPDGCRVRAATSDDLDAANLLCERVHGHNRSGELQDGIAQGTARVVERSGLITGYASGFGYFGHAAGESLADIQALIASADHIDGPGILVPTRNAELFRWCLNNGLRVVQPMTLMTMGLYNEPSGVWLPSILY